MHRGAAIDMPDLNASTNGVSTGGRLLLPHYFLLPTYASASSYRIRPLGPEECLFELWSLTRYPPGQGAPRPADPDPDGRPTIPAGRPIPGQDYSNLPRQQRGLHAEGFDYMRLSAMSRA